MSAASLRPGRAWNSGEARSSAIPLAVSSPKPLTTRKKFCSAKWTSTRWKRCAATGPSCAIAASTVTLPSPTACWMENDRRKMTKRPAARAHLLPSALGYRMPAEWEPHESTWMAWPHLRGDWPGKFEPILWVYAEIIRHLARHLRVDLIVNSAHAEKRAQAVLEKTDALSDNVAFHHWRTDRVW